SHNIRPRDLTLHDAHDSENQENTKITHSTESWAYPHNVSIDITQESRLNTESTPKPNPRPDPWTRYFTFNIDINNDSLNHLFRSQTCPDIRVAPEFCP
ncbi:Roundabout-like 4, partial [Manis pentadactyla]